MLVNISFFSGLFLLGLMGTIFFLVFLKIILQIFLFVSKTLEAESAWRHQQCIQWYKGLEMHVRSHLYHISRRAASRVTHGAVSPIWKKCWQEVLETDPRPGLVKGKKDQSCAVPIPHRPVQSPSSVQYWHDYNKFPGFSAKFFPVWMWYF